MTEGRSVVNKDSGHLDMYLYMLDIQELRDTYVGSPLPTEVSERVHYRAVEVSNAIHWTN